MLIISDLSYVEVISASSILGGSAQIFGTSTTTTSTNNSFVKKQVGLNVNLPNPKLTPADLEIEKALLAL